MGNTWIVDLRHYLDPPGAFADMPGPGQAARGVFRLIAHPQTERVCPAGRTKEKALSLNRVGNGRRNARHYREYSQEYGVRVAEWADPAVESFAGQGRRGRTGGNRPTCGHPPTRTAGSRVATDVRA
jgi:hypothetical protein